MFASPGLRSFFPALCVLIVVHASCVAASAADLLLSDVGLFPGQLWQSKSGAPETLLFRREATANPAFPRAATKLAQVAVGADGKIYFASGLDGYVLHLLDRRNEVVSFEFPGQIRDLDGGGEEHTVYFSVVPTPQNGETLADGKIYRRDLWAGQPSEFAVVRQSQVGGNWWGTFAIQNGIVYLATLDRPSRLYKLTSTGPEPVFTTNRHFVQGLTSAAGSFYFADGMGRIYRTADFDQVETVLDAAHKFTDVAVEPVAAGN